MATKELTLEIASDLSQLSKVEAFVEQLCDEFNIYNNYYSNILVAVTEAFTNAVQHGNRNDLTKIVTIKFNLAPAGLLFSIEDQGLGFNSDFIPDPTDIRNLDAFAGRGIYLIKHLSDEVNFVNNGTKIEMLFKISSINQETSIKRADLFKDYIMAGSKKYSESNG